MSPLRLGIRAFLGLALAATWCVAAETAPPAAGDASLVSEEDKWVFTPPVGRPDIFYDYQQILALEKGIIAEPTGTPRPDQTTENDDVLEVTRQQVQRIETFMSQRKWDEAIKVCDQAIKKLAAYPNNPEAVKYLQVIKGYQVQAQDALLRDEAQAAFDALNLKVEGILWSENGPRLAIISGEPRALGVNDRVKECVIINIDTDRVDFRYHYKRKRFEFPRYVGEDLKK